MSERPLTWEEARPEVYWFDPFFLTMIQSAIVPAAAGSSPRLLHLGCGTGVKTETCRRLGYDAFGIDLDPSLAEKAQRSFPEAHFRCGDIQALPFADAFFDVVFSFSTLQLVEDRSRAIAEAARVLKPGGRAVFIENLRGSPLARGYRAMHRALRLRYSRFETPKVHLALEDIALFERSFVGVVTSFHHLTTPLTLVVPTIASRLGGLPIHVQSIHAYRALARIDRAIFRRWTWSHRFAWHVVATMLRPS